MYILYDASQSVFPRRMSTEYSHLELRGIIFRVRGRKEIDHSKHAPLPSMQMDKSRASFWLGEPTFVSKYKATKNSHSMLSAKLRREFMTCWQIKQLLILYTISLLDLPLEISFYQHCSLAYFSMRWRYQRFLSAEILTLTDHLGLRRSPGICKNAPLSWWICGQKEMGSIGPAISKGGEDHSRDKFGGKKKWVLLVQQYPKATMAMSRNTSWKRWLSSSINLDTNAGIKKNKSAGSI